MMTTFLLTLGWAVYLGGALAMEIVWRPTQRHIPGSQTGVLCQGMGRRYRWIALGSLALIAGSAVFRLVELGYLSTSRPFVHPPLGLSQSYGRTVVAVALCWIVLLVSVVAMSSALHPALHARARADVTAEERAVARRRLERAIRRMDVALRVDLGVALVAGLLTVSLGGGGLL